METSTNVELYAGGQHSDHTKADDNPPQLHEEAASLDSGEEDSDLELELGGEGGLLGEEARTANELLLQGVSTPGRSRQVIAVTPRFDLVSPYKRLRLDDLTQSSMDSSQAAGEGEAHSLLKSCDDEEDDDVGGRDDDGSVRTGHGHWSSGIPIPAAFDAAVDRDVREGTPQTSENSSQSETSSAPQKSSSSSERHTGRKKKSFFHNLFGKANFPRKTTNLSADKNGHPNTLSREVVKPDHKHKTPLKDVRNLSWSQDHQSSNKTTCKSWLSHAPQNSHWQQTSTIAVPTILSPQELRRSIPYIDEVCLEEDPFMSADEREFPPPPALDRGRRPSIRSKSLRGSTTGCADLYRPDYQTLESRQICLEPNRRAVIDDEADDNADEGGVDSADFNVYDKIDGDEDDIADDGPRHSVGSENRTRHVSVAEIPALKAAAEVCTAVSSSGISKSAGTSCDQDGTCGPNKSAKSVGTSCANIPATLRELNGMDAPHNMAAPSESSVFTAETRGTTGSDDISAVYDTVDSVSEVGVELNVQDRDVNKGDTGSITSTSNSHRSTVHLNTIHSTIHTEAGSGHCPRTSDTKLTVSSGVSTRDLWDGQEVNAGSRSVKIDFHLVLVRSFLFENKTYC